MFSTMGETLPERRMASQLMMRFSERSGLIGDAPKRRYLWTDAFAVCNLLGLTQATGDGRYVELALRLIDAVPFSQQVNPKRGTMMMPLMLAGGIAISVVVAFQYFFLFRSTALVVLVTILVAATAYWLTRGSLHVVADSMRHFLASVSGESDRLCREVEV